MKFGVIGFGNMGGAIVKGAAARHTWQCLSRRWPMAA